MKKLTALLLAVVMVFSMITTALAASVTPEFSTTAVEAGQDVTVTLTLDEAIENVVSLDYRLYFDSDLFALKSSENGDAHSAMLISELKTDPKGTSYMISFVDTTSVGQTIAAGTLYTLTFTAKADLTEEQSVAFELVNKGVYDPNYGTIDVPVTNGSISVSVVPEGSSDESDEPTTTEYTVSASADVSAAVGETAEVKVTVDSEKVETYNAYDLSLTYDADKLEYVSGTAADEKADIAAENGTIRVIGYGADKKFETAAVTLTFKTKTTEAANVTITSAKVDVKENANVQDAPEATITDNTTVITGTAYTVTLPDILSGAATAAPGEDYTFTATDADNYNYTITVKVNGEEVAFTANGDGTYTIPGASVNGNIEIEATREAKTYDVTFGEGATGDDKATYGEDYTFTVEQEDGYTTEVTVTIGGKDYTGYTAENGTYTIPGADITGAIEVSVTKTEIPTESVKVTFNGNGAGDADGEATAAIGKTYTFTVNKVTGFDYAITATMGGTSVNVSESNGSYSIANVTDDLVITVTRTAQAGTEGGVVDVKEYITLDEQAMFLVTVSGVAEGSIAKYDGQSMYWSEQYEGYAYLVISEEGLEAVKTAAEAAVTTSAGDAAGTVDNSGDVNGTKLTDVNDAQLTYDMYNAVYGSFDEVSMLKFLNADVTGDMKVDVNDTAKIVSIMKSN